MKHILALLLFASLANATHDCLYDVWQYCYVPRLPKDYTAQLYVDNDYCIIITKDKLCCVGIGKTLDEAFNSLQKDIELSKLLPDDNDN